jgi:type VII secretion protein EccB
MPSRQDQLHSYQFMVQRVVAALVMRETDPAQSPFRRAGAAALASVLVAAIALAGVGVYGLIVGGGSTNWRDEQAVIVEEDTGALFVYRDQKLHPVLNYASALLIIGSATPKTVNVSRKSIDGVARGTPLGIADAPDSLAQAQRLVGTPWTLCSTLPTQGASAPKSVLLVGPDAGGNAPTSGSALGDQGLLVRDIAGGTHLIWHNARHRISNQNLVLSALGWSSQQPITMAPALINAVPAGADLRPIDIPGRGEPSSQVPNATVGEVFVVQSQGGERQYAVAMRNGLAEITQVQADLILTDPNTKRLVGQKSPNSLGQADFGSARKATSLVPQGAQAPPAQTPNLVTQDSGATCAVIRDDTGVAEMRVRATVPDVSNATPTGARTTDGTALADLVVVQPGRGAVVESASAPGATGGALSVVTDQGVRYAVANRGVLAMLGYGSVQPVRVPANLVALLPAGRALDPDAARAPAVRG